MLGEAKLRTWLDNGYHGKMKWMQTYLDVRLHPERLLEGAQSALLFLWKYPQKIRPPQDNAALRIAAYAQGEDYHHTLGKWLGLLISELKGKDPSVSCRSFVDAMPVLERELAVLGGLGWIGRNSMLIHPRHGSGFLIGGILITQLWERSGGIDPNNDLCGSCTRCVDACPTGAIHADRQVNANNCISYLTIEKDDAFSESESESLGNWLFGCDACQSCCPWNKKHLGTETPFWPSTREEWSRLLIPGNGLRSLMRGTPLWRSGRKGLVRNFSSIASKKENPG